MKTFPKNVNVRANLHTRYGVKYKTWAVDPDGTEHPLSDWKSNLILDTGLDMLGNSASLSSPVTVGSFAHIGTGLTPVKRGSGVITFTQAGNVITASAPFFAAADPGRLFKFGAGAGGFETYINVFTDNQHVVVADVHVQAVPIVGAVWYVNETALTAQVFVTSTYSTGAGECGSTVVVAGTAFSTHKRTFLFPAVGAITTFNEIGWSVGGGAGPLFGRDLISPGDTLLIGQQYKVSMTLTVTYSPHVPEVSPNVGTLMDTTGFLSIESLELGSAVGTIQANGNIGVRGLLEIAGIGNFPAGAFLVSAAYAQNANPDTGSGGVLIATPNRLNVPATLLPYSAGSFFRDVQAFFPANTFAGNIFGIGISDNNNHMPLDVVFNAAQPMTLLQSLTFVFRYSWQRQLFN